MSDDNNKSGSLFSVMGLAEGECKETIFWYEFLKRQNLDNIFTLTMENHIILTTGKCLN